jgi:hypothetical protein
MKIYNTHKRSISIAIMCALIFCATLCTCVNPNNIGTWELSVTGVSYYTISDSLRIVMDADISGFNFYQDKEKTLPLDFSSIITIQGQPETYSVNGISGHLLELHASTPIVDTTPTIVEFKTDQWFYASSTGGEFSTTQFKTRIITPSYNITFN